MNLHKLIFTECASYKAAIKIKPKGVMVHSTGANNPNLKRYVGPDDGLLGKNQYNNHWNMMGVGASVHAFIGKLKDGSIATYQVLPFYYKSGHCYKGPKGSGNDTHISFEICEDDTNDPVYFSKVYQEAVEFTAMICKEFGFDPMADGVIIDHSEGHDRGIASNHGDVGHWFPKHGKSMDTFRADVKAMLGGEKETATETKTEVEGYTMNMRNLSRGCRGEDVRALQILLAGRGYNGKMNKPDGIFGPNTEGAVKLYQKAKGLTVDGIAGPKTLGKLLGV